MPVSERNANAAGEGNSKNEAMKSSVRKASAKSNQCDDSMDEGEDEEEDTLGDCDGEDNIHRHTDTDDEFEIKHLYVDIAEDAAVATDDANEGLHPVTRDNCDCNLSRHYTACQFVRSVHMWNSQAWVEVLRRHYGLRGFRDLRALKLVDTQFLVEEFKSLLRYVENGTYLQATILAFAVKRVKGRYRRRSLPA